MALDLFVVRETSPNCAEGANAERFEVSVSLRHDPLPSRHVGLVETNPRSAAPGLHSRRPTESLPARSPASFLPEPRLFLSRPRPLVSDAWRKMAAPVDVEMQEAPSVKEGFYRVELAKTAWEVPSRYQDLSPIGTGAYGTVWCVLYASPCFPRRDA